MHKVALVVALVCGARAARADSVDATAAATVRAACKEDTRKLQRVVVPAPQVDWRDGGLVVELGRAFSFEGGAVELYGAAADDEPTLAPLPMSAEQGAVFVRARAKDRLSALLTFELVSGALVAEPCLALAGGRILRARYRPVRLELFDLGSEEGKTQKRAAAVFQPPGAAEAERAQPRVAIGAIALNHRSEEIYRASIERSLAELEPALRRCYLEALQRRPGLTGRIVLGVTLDRARLQIARVEIDSLADAALTRCARAAVEELHPPAGNRVAAFSLPIGFERR